MIFECECVTDGKRGKLWLPLDQRGFDPPCNELKREKRGAEESRRVGLPRHWGSRAAVLCPCSMLCMVHSHGTCSQLRASYRGRSGAGARAVWEPHSTRGAGAAGGTGDFSHPGADSAPAGLSCGGGGTPMSWYPSEGRCSHASHMEFGVGGGGLMMKSLF